MYSDTHVHTCFSFDSEMDPESAVKKAADLGLFSITFTDHFDLDYPGYGDTVCFDFDKYIETIDELKEKYEKKLGIKIFKGVEVGIRPHVMDRELSAVKGKNFDVIIGSTHIVDGMDPYDSVFFEKGSKMQTYGRYLDTVIDNLEYYKNFDVFAHYDYLVRYAPYEDKIFRYSDMPDKIDYILKFIIENGMSLEINTSTYGRVSPDKAILERYVKLGGEIATMASDGHTEAKIGRSFKKFSCFARSCGIKYIGHFENRKFIAE